ncbi:MAG: hypothetical protein NVS4B11_35220 [Ktedonobacteraceae bacterium]
MRPQLPSKTAWSLRHWVLLGALLLTLLGLVGYGTATALAHTTGTQTSAHHCPVVVTVFSPGKGDTAGLAGAGYVIDLSLDAARPADNAYLSAANGYKPFFNDPTSTTFHPGSDLGAPGLVVLLSTTKTIPGTPFVGPGTNLAGLFQINGVSKVNHGTLAETWNTWQVGKPIAGAGVQTTLTVFVVKGTAPTVISGAPEDQPGRISNIVRVTFTIAG